MTNNVRKTKEGIVYLVGAGPGDPGLLTMKGARLLAQADAVVYDRLVNPEILDLAPDAVKIFAGKNHFRNGQSCSAKSSLPQAKINQMLARLAGEGKKIIRLKGGDPFIFGRGGEEAGFLADRGVRFEIVPGVTAGWGVPAYAGIPLTDRRLSSSVVFVTAHHDPRKKMNPADWKKLAGFPGTLVFFMTVKTMPQVAAALIKEGKSGRTPAAVIERGTLPQQKTVYGTLATIAAKIKSRRIQAPALMVIGDVVRLREKLAWLEKKPLAGRTVLITRPKAQAGTLKNLLEQNGARTLELPAIRIEPPADWSRLDRAVRNIKSYDTVIFTSTNAVDAFFKRLERYGLDGRALAGVHLAAIGSATARRLKDFGLAPDWIPEVFTTEGLLALLDKNHQIRGRKFLLPRTDIAPEFLLKELLRQGAAVDQVIAYRTVAEPGSRAALKRMIAGEKIDFVIFTSASTVDSFFRMLTPVLKRRLKSVKLVTIGPVTSRELRRQGCRAYREAKIHTIEGLVDTLIEG